MPLFPRTQDYLEDKLESLRDLQHPSTHRRKVWRRPWYTVPSKLLLFLALLFIVLTVLELALR